MRFYQNILGLSERLKLFSGFPAGSVLKMFQYALGDSTWSKGLHFYLNAKEFDAAISDDLYAGIQTAVNQDYPTNPPNVALMMRSWETQSGFPYVTVTRNGNQLQFEQNRFMYADRTSTNLWHIPINYVVGSNPDFTNTKPDIWMAGYRSFFFESNVAPKPFTDNDWIIVNIQQTSYYRVNYDLTLWGQITAQLNLADDGFEKIHLFNRAQLIDDSYHFARAELLNYDVLFGILNYLERETDYVPWVAANRANTMLNRWISGSTSYPNFQAFMRRNVAAYFNSLGVYNRENDHRLDRFGRTIAINIACESQLPACLTQTTEHLQSIVNGAAIHPDLITPIYCNGMRNASATLYVGMENRLLGSTSTTERNAVISGMGCTQNTQHLMEFFQMAVNTEVPLTNAERSRILTSAINIGEASIRTMINFLRENFSSVAAYGLVPTMCSNIAARISNQQLSTEFISLLSLLQTNGVLTAAQVTTYTNSAATLMNWQNTNLRYVESFFETNEETTLPGTTVVNTTPAPSTDSTTLGAGNVALSAGILIFSILAKFLM